MHSRLIAVRRTGERLLTIYYVMILVLYCRMAYLHHLYKAYELTAMTLATIHNLTFMVDFFADARRRILNDEL